MGCSEENKVTLGTYMLREEANHWWKNARQRLGVGGVVITWERFKREFLIKYFPADVRNRKVVEFMELKQGMNKSRICDEDGRAKSNYYKAVKDKKRKEQDCGKSYGDENKRDGESSGR
ncbi:hypothetical protein A2U01_0043347, partial [Trifolium medium]|nr:hypothetical protein [Trifolium medium]